MPKLYKPKRRHDEDDLQHAVVTLLALYERQGHLRSFAVPNGGKRNKREAARMKGLGTRAGVSDLVVIIVPRSHTSIRAPKNPAKVLFWELKSPTGKLSPAQKDWGAWLQDVGLQSYIVRSVDDAQRILKWHMGSERNAA